MKKLKENLIPLSAMLSIPLFSLIYTLINNTNRGVYSLTTDLDKKVPFISAFVVPYSLWYLFIIGILLYLCLKDRRAYMRTISSFAVGYIICLIIFFFFETTVARPVLTGNDVFTKLVAFIYSADKPYNCFPSVHVLSSYLMVKGIDDCREKNNSLSIAVRIMALLIILSTQFIKQHVILDAVFAIMMSEIIFKCISMIDEERVLLWIKKRYSLWTMKKKLES